MAQINRGKTSCLCTLSRSNPKGAHDFRSIAKHTQHGCSLDNAPSSHVSSERSQARMQNRRGHRCLAVTSVSHHLRAHCSAFEINSCMCFSALEEPSQNFLISLRCGAWESPLSCSLLVSEALDFAITIEASVFQEVTFGKYCGRLVEVFVNAVALLGCCRALVSRRNDRTAY